MSSNIEKRRAEHNAERGAAHERFGDDGYRRSLRLHTPSLREHGADLGCDKSHDHGVSHKAQ